MTDSFPYATPRCEYDKLESLELLSSSDLTDDGAGEFLTDGGEFDF